MFSRFRIAFGLAWLLSLIIASTVFAKGSFAFITITGPNLRSEVRATDPVLTTDFFAFADFYRNRVDVPANPGEAYEITRYYIDHTRESAFDRLHYYPDTGYVFYDGIVNGSSEYDGKWYRAVPEIKTAFEKALSAQAVAPVVDVEPVQPKVEQPVAPVQSESSTERARTMPSLFQNPVIAILIASSVALSLVFMLRSRRTAPR